MMFFLEGLAARFLAEHWRNNWRSACLLCNDLEPLR